MMELVDMLDSKSGDRKVVGVQVPLWVYNESNPSKYARWIGEKSGIRGSVT